MKPAHSAARSRTVCEMFYECRALANGFRSVEQVGRFDEKTIVALMDEGVSFPEIKAVLRFAFSTDAGKRWATGEQALTDIDSFVRAYDKLAILTDKYIDRAQAPACSRGQQRRSLEYDEAKAEAAFAANTGKTIDMQNAGRQL